MRVALLAVAALVLAGCASNPPAAAANDVVDPAEGALASVRAVEAVPLRFAVGDFESVTSYTKTFQPTDMCIPECQGTAMQIIDLTEVIPADAPVELAITISSDGSVNGDLVYQDAQPVDERGNDGGNQGGGGGGGDTLSAIVTRAATGTVELHLFHGGFNFPPSTTPVEATIEVRSVVRADILVQGVPAAVRLEPGTVLNFTGETVEQAVLITSTGEIIRDVDGPFTITVPNGTVGDSIVMLTGGSGQVHGPNVTMTARRVVVLEGPAHDITSGSGASWEFQAVTAPVLVGVGVRTKDGGTGTGGSGGAFMGAYSIAVTGPGNVVVLEVDVTCGGGGIPFPACEFNPFPFGSSRSEYSTLYLDEDLRAGAYAVALSVQQANGYEAYEFQMQIV